MYIFRRVTKFVGGQYTGQIRAQKFNLINLITDYVSRTA